MAATARVRALFSTGGRDENFTALSIPQSDHVTMYDKYNLFKE